MDAATLTTQQKQQVEQLTLEVYRSAEKAGKRGKQLLTRQEMYALLAALPEETMREYELRVTEFSVRWDESVLRGEDFRALLSAAREEAVAPETEKVAFAAFCVAVNHERRMKNSTEEARLLEAWKDIFGGHVFYRHLQVLSRTDQLENFREIAWDEARLRELLQLCSENAAALGNNNVGGKHAFASTVALACENMPETMAEIQKNDRINWLNRALDAVTDALEKADYAKFYCTRARLLALDGKYDEALMSINEAIDKEDSGRPDYAIRVGRYLTYSQQFRAKKEIKAMESAMQASLEQYKDALEEQEKQTLVKNMEFLGLFSGIVSFTIGSLTISGAIAEQSIKNAAGLIVVLMGALMAVFASFGIILHGMHNKKASRNLGVLALGFICVLGGLAFCLC